MVCVEELGISKYGKSEGPSIPTLGPEVQELWEKITAEEYVSVSGSIVIQA